MAARPAFDRTTPRDCRRFSPGRPSPAHEAAPGHWANGAEPEGLARWAPAPRQGSWMLKAAHEPGAHAPASRTLPTLPGPGETLVEVNGQAKELVLMSRCVFEGWALALATLFSLSH